ncbi:DUF1574 family protein [Legionella quateirensis]|uniref:Uncharacterized protein n=1 Tax=Legionella quateirensis TaxID=45072 RepID=A0A378KZ12_9GAMM|nr:DUF1574 family protein [Legionella quateirensis]KTD47637.1 hypothetical protein Lqua_2030 [Legionella quateirensis]STY18608.1 Uncharacterised protein [Legionella quateirensis]
MSDIHCEKTYRRGLFKQGLIGVFILLAVFLFLELFSRWIAVTSTAPFGESIRNDQKMMVSDSIKGGVVAIGDSIIARGFYPELFSSLLAEKLSKHYEVYNIGVDGTGIEQHRAYLRYILKKQVKPDWVIMNVSIHNLNLENFSFDANHVAHSNYVDNNSLDYYTRCFVLDKPTMAAKMYCKAARFSYFFRLVHFYHQQINTGAQAILHTNKWRVNNLFSGYPAISDKGFSPTFGTLSEESANAPLMHDAMVGQYTRAFANFKLGTDGLDIIIDELNAHSIKVVLVLAPMYQPLMRKIYDEYGLPSNDVLESTLSQYALRKNIAFVNLFEAYQNPIYFQDPVHLNIYGAIKFTSTLANRIINKQYTASNGYLNTEIFQYLKGSTVRTT